MAKPTFEQIQAWTTARIAVKSGSSTHAFTLRGWAIYNGPGVTGMATGTKFVIFNDPWDGLMHVQSYDSIDIVETDVPGGSPTGRKEESSVKEDPDEDDIMSFDETNRFGTDPNKDDTDDDCITDQFDMHSFLYTTHDTYSPSYADWDGDGKRKHVDPDNDNGGVIDGDEDGNWNGHLDANETNNFDPADDARAPRTCRPPATPEPTATSVTIPPATEEPVDEVLIGVVATILFDDAGHGPFINMPGFFEILFNFPNGMVTGPFPWVTVSGTFGQEGSVMAQGTGTVAGFSNIEVTLEGELTDQGFVGEYTMGTGGGLPGGVPITYFLEGQLVEIQPEATPTQGAPDVEATPTQTVSEVDPGPTQGSNEAASFYSDFNTAFAFGDVDRLVSMLHPSVIDLYGADACQTYLAGIVENVIHVTVEDVIDFGTWNWQIDNRLTAVEDVYTIAIAITVQDQMNFGQSHLGLLEDGSLSWFTDCGDPLQ